jgi:hypothetical protein
MTDSLKHHESKDAGTRAELADLKIHTMALTQAVMGILRNLGQQGQQQRPPMGAQPPGGGINPAILQRIIAAKRAQAMQGQPMGGALGAPPPAAMGQPPPGVRPPGMALGGLQMGLNRLEPTGAFTRGIAHSLTPTKLNFHSPHIAHFALGGMPMRPGMMPMNRMGAPPMGQPMGAGQMASPMAHTGPAINPAMLSMLAAKYGMR